MFLLVAVGSGILVLLGVSHVVFTLQSTPEAGPMTPVDPEVRKAMTVTGGIGLAPELESTLWRSWVGFNLSHSFGAIAIGCFIGIPAIIDLGAATADVWWVVLALALPPAYLVLSVRYWFKDPTVGIGLATALIWGGVLVELV